MRATLRVEGDQTLRLVETAFPSVGPGLPPLGPDGTWTIEDGLIVNRAPSAPLPELRLRTVPLTQHRLDPALRPGARPRRARRAGRRDSRGRPVKEQPHGELGR